MNVFSFALRKRDKRRKKLGKRRRKGRKVKENSLTVGDPLGVRVRRERKVSHLTLHVDGGAALVDLDEALGLAAVGAQGGVRPVFLERGEFFRKKSRGGRK